MSAVNINLGIGGRTFTVSATEGEEAHVEMLGRMIEERVRKIGSAGQNEGRMLLFAALLLADELHEKHRNEPPPPPIERGPEVSPEVLARIEALAARVEKLATHLEQAGVTP